MYTDKKLVCKECGTEFVFTAGEQDKEGRPVYCKACYASKK